MQSAFCHFNSLRIEGSENRYGECCENFDNFGMSNGFYLICRNFLYNICYEFYKR